MTAGQRSVTSPDGTPIAVFSSGDGPPLLLVHGATADHTTWRSLGPVLEPRFRLLAIDRRGRGASGDGPAYSIEKEYEDLATVADEAADEALAYHASGRPVDPHSADQLLLPLAVADGESEYHVSEVTRHLTTNAAVIQLFLDRDITIAGDEGATWVVRVSGRAL